MTTRTAPANALIDAYRRWPVEFVSGSGARLVDSSGRAYIDLLSGISVASVGHCHPRMVDAIARQSRELIHVSNLFHTRPQQELADHLQRLTGNMLSFFTNSGAEAIECALKLARKHAYIRGVDAPTIIAAHNSFHGRTFGALAATGQPGKQEPFRPMLPGFVHVEFGDVEALRSAVGETGGAVAVLLEPIQGEAGVVVPPDNYLRAVRELCDELELLLILDEVQTGLGRTGRWFAHQHFDVTPDVMCLAKALAGGLPIGACLAAPSVAAVLEPGDHATTFGGGPVVAAAALAVLDAIESEGLVERAADVGGRLLQRLQRIAPPDATVRGKGMLIGVELARPVARDVVAAALDRGVVINDATPSVVRIAPPLVIEEAELDQALQVLQEVFDEI